MRALVALTAEPARREAAIGVLSGLPPRRIADVAAGLRHPSPDVRCASVEALGRMKRPDASRALESALDDEHPAVRLAVIAGALEPRDARAPKKLMTLARTDPDAEVRRAAMLAVSRSGAGHPDSIVGVVAIDDAVSSRFPRAVGRRHHASSAT